MASPNSTLRHRGPKEKQKANGDLKTEDTTLDKVLESSKQAVTSEWDYKLALGIIVVVSFITRFFGISHPNEVVFDEVHFGKVGKLEKCTREAMSDPTCSSHRTTSSEPTFFMLRLPS